MANITRSEYNACVGDAMRGKTMTKEERKLEFCVVAKTCSGKVKTREEGLEICRRPKAPKAPKGTKPRKGKGDCVTQMAQVAQCLFGSSITPETSVEEIHNLLSQCYCSKNPTSRTSRMKIISPEQQEALAIMARITDEYAAH